MNRWDVMTRRIKKDGGTYWHKVGSAFQGDKGINISFDSLPMPDAEGKCWVSLFEPRDANNRPQPSGTSRRDLDDDVPF